MIPDRSLVKQARDLAANDNLSIYEISHRLGLSKSTVHRWTKDLITPERKSSFRCRPRGKYKQSKPKEDIVVESKPDVKIEQPKPTIILVKSEPKHPTANKALLKAKLRELRDRDRYLGRDGWSRFEDIL